MRQKQTVVVALALMLLIVGFSRVGFADQSASSNYQVDETFFGSGGELDASSSNYRSKQSAGELGVGNTSSTNYQAQAGFNTDRVPYLQFVVNAATINLGTLIPNHPVTANGAFSIRSYLSSGYIVQTASAGPSNGSYSLKTMTTAAANDSTKEEFGINLVANTNPATFGADPSQVPDVTFGFGQAAPGYNTVNQFKFNKGDTVAYANSSSGETDFTISYLLNITNLTPGGSYAFNHVLVATSTF